MSTRGGYCFVLDGKETIVYTGNHAEFSILGDIMLEWVKDFTSKNPAQQNAIKENISGLVETSPAALVPEDILREVLHKHPFILPVSISKEYDWSSVMRYLANSPEELLNLGHYIDGSWLIDSVDCEYLYVIDFDNDMFEVYYNTVMASGLPASGRFNERAYPAETEVNRREAQYINMLASYSFDALPDSVAGLNEDIYEEEFWEMYLPKP